MKMRRGLSTMVGAVFFVIALSSAAAYLSYSMNSLDDFAQSIIVKDAQSIDRLKEDIEITSVTLTDTNKFNMTVLNKGSIPTKLVRLWVTDESSNPITHQKEDLNVLINSGEQGQNIATNLDITANPTDSYTLKAVTERGSTASFALSTDISTQIDLIVSATVLPLQQFYVTAVITNNSTTPSGIANLTATMKNNATLTPTIIPTPSSIMGFDNDETALFTWSFNSPSSDTLIQFNASYVGAPGNVNATKLVDVESVQSSQSATSSKWSEKARRVGILISGIPNPMEPKPSGSGGDGRWGIGLINPLDRPVEIIALGIASPTAKIFKGAAPTGVEPTTNWKNVATTGQFSMMIWESKNNPIHVPPGDVAQFRVLKDFDEEKSVLEAPLFVEVLTSEGKLFAVYTITADKESGPWGDGSPTISSFYTKDPTNHLGGPLDSDNWGFIKNDVQSGQKVQYNVTIYNSSNTPPDKIHKLDAEIVLVVLLPKAFSGIEADPQAGWDPATILLNPDGSNFIKVNTTETFLDENTHITFSFNATAPVVTENSIYIFQTTTFYPAWTQGPEIASSVSEAGIVVIP